ncbi:MAG: twin-arginine translocase subunit TatC [Acidobacteria bacterium]|nr:twin-arginine translocase subunit TatC [Acidobacteriota bacterium]
MAAGLFRRSRANAGKLPASGDDPAADSAFDGEEGTPGAKMSFLEHLDELRRRIVVSLVGVLVGCLISFTFIGRIYDFIMKPLAQMLPAGSSLVWTEPTEMFVLYLKIALLSGIILAAPVVLSQVWLFVAPGLYAREKRLAIPFVVLGTIGFVVGAGFSHYLLFPVTWRFLASFANEYTNPMLKVESVFSLYAKMMLGVGIIFQMPTAVYFLARMGVVTARFMIRNFKYAVLIIFIIAAIITPTGDPLTQTLFAGPMIGLYLISIMIAWIFQKKRREDPDAAT